MKRDDQARLDIAYAAWRAAAPADAQVEAGARRVAAALERTPVRRRWKLVPMLVGATALGAALAYAASGPLGSLLGVEPPAPSSAARAKTPERVVTLPSPPPRAVPAPLGEAPRDEAADVPQGSGAPPALPTSRAGATRKLNSKASDAASWHAVDQALARGDERAAQTALAGLDTEASDDATRAKSRLGLAQLALGRGDCDQARRFALSVLALADADAKVQQRARDLVARCRADGN
jgi:hypothetical protein